MPGLRRIGRDGVGLHVEIDGPENGFPVVFLHGVTGSGRTWEWLPDEITHGRRIVRIDFRGHGRSDHAPGHYGLPDYGADVVAVLHEVAARPAVLVGHSLGGVVAWWVAQQHPELVAAAFLEDPPLYYGGGAAPPEPFRTVFTARRVDALEFQRAGLSDEEVAERMAVVPMGPPGAPTMREVLTDDAVAAIAFAHRRMDIGVIDGAIDGSTLAATDVDSPVSPPVFLLAADDAMGAAFTTQHAERLARTHPAVEVARAAGSGHGIHDGRVHREVFTQHLRRFLDTHAPV